MSLLSVGAYAGGHCTPEAPFAYVWGVEETSEGRTYFYSNVIKLGAESYADLVSEFAIRARDQYDARPSAKPSRCFASAGQANSDLRRLRANQRERGARQLDIRW
ncbi:MAG: hypothetical protein Tsb0010_06110 [Parvularculaceae bacterium]